jgi:hypothetical protein
MNRQLRRRSMLAATLGFAILGPLTVGVLRSNVSLAASDHEAPKEAGNFLAPVNGLHGHFCGIHCARSNPKIQIIAQHYCAPHGDQMHQCVLFDSTGPNAKLLGVEYIITDKAYRALPDTEKKYWHPHTYEVLAGGLIAPGMSPDDEMKFMKNLITTWGKTWHTWPDPKTAVPMGEPLLMWALTGDGQEDKDVIAKRDKEFGVSSAALRAKRTEALNLEVPQIPQPKTMDAIGRQWTADGEDKPKARK